LEAIRISQPEALGAVKGHLWFADCYAIAVKKLAHRIHVSALEEQRGISMSSDAFGVRDWWPFASIVG
jgi:hypothetical protein